MITLLYVGIGASLGAAVRYAITNFGKKHWSHIFPFATMLINLSGALLLGFLFARQVSPIIYAFLGTGILGGYTTFSTLNVELAGQIRDRQYTRFFLYLLTSYAGGLVFVYCGYILGK
ncbi:fluoride efflux transporter CrcB [uncultured Lactobacillus sp.]|uniref:fluoride efflux transporter CrcB n=1 Tax=uncultured Lactobacillus sp. TaxID=153152 RepID=UPI002605D039|nr:fluoride efflux transporter CrcB [uncultured Lactobacillus sp.]